MTSDTIEVVSITGAHIITGCDHVGESTWYGRVYAGNSAHKRPFLVILANKDDYMSNLFA